jgi:hypothetical protein
VPGIDLQLSGGRKKSSPRAFPLGELVVAADQLVPDLLDRVDVSVLLLRVDPRPERRAEVKAVMQARFVFSERR